MGLHVVAYFPTGFSPGPSNFLSHILVGTALEEPGGGNYCFIDIMDIQGTGTGAGPCSDVTMSCIGCSCCCILLSVFLGPAISCVFSVYGRCKHCCWFAVICAANC